MKNERIAKIICDYHKRYFQKQQDIEFGVSNKNVYLRKRKAEKPVPAWKRYMCQDRTVKHRILLLNNTQCCEKPELVEQNHVKKIKDTFGGLIDL